METALVLGVAFIPMKTIPGMTLNIFCSLMHPGFVPFDLVGQVKTPTHRQVSMDRKKGNG